MPLVYLFFTLKQHSMKKWFKENWKVIAPFLIVVITDLFPLFYNDKTFMSQLGINDNLAFAIRTIGAFMAMYFGKVNILSMVGGRKKRKKKPKGLPQYPNMEYTFEGNDFNLQSVVTYTSDVNIEYPISVVSVWDSPNSQTVIFNELAQFTDFETLYFEVEVD